MDAFESLMKKKLGGKYVKPSFIDEAKPEDKTKLDDKDTLENKSSEDETDEEESVQLTPPPKSVSDDITLTPPPKTPVKGGKRKAKLIPRVSCGECDFIGIQGKEMDMHKIKKHKQKKPCDECQFEADLSIILRRHKLSKHHHKCESCEFSTRTSSALENHKRLEHEGGVLRTTAGFMITSDASSIIETEPQDRGLNLQTSKK